MANGILKSFGLLGNLAALITTNQRGITYSPNKVLNIGKFIMKLISLFISGFNYCENMWGKEPLVLFVATLVYARVAVQRCLSLS